MKLSAGALLAGFIILAVGCDAQKNANAPAATPTVSWTRFADPLEQAFSLEVPKGWNVRGGLYRKGVLDPRGMIEVTSPDGKIFYRIGDAAVPPYSIPTQLGYRLGFREGSPYSPGGRVQSVIARFRTGTQFADMYAQARFANICRNLQVKMIRKAAPAIPYGFGGDTAGEVAFTCNDGALAGYVYAETSLIGTQTEGLWVVPVKYSFVAPKEQAKLAMQLLAHSLATYRENPQWTQAQNAMLGQVNKQIQGEANASLANAEHQRQRTDQQLKLAEDFDDVINGVTLTRDPSTGQTREIWTSQNPNHWIGPLDNVVSTPTDSQPGPNYRRLDTIRRGQQ